MKRQLLACLLLISASAACGGEKEEPEVAGDTTVTLVTHDSFAATEAVLESFRDETGITIEILPSGDAGEVVNKSVLTKGNPLGDILFGVDNTFLSRALENDLFVPYAAEGLASVPDEFQLDRERRVTPIDHGEVCVNFDTEVFRPGAMTPPDSLTSLTQPEYRDQLVVQNPATSSPGLAFLLATVERFGDPGWESYWTRLKANGVQVTSGWEEAYNGAFSGGAGMGDRPIVVSYASSPPAEVHFAEPGSPSAAGPSTAVMEDGCFRQIEFAGILRGSENVEASKKVIDFLLSKEFQADLPLNMFVFPVVDGIELPTVFEQYAAKPADPLVMDAARIDANRERWVKRWTALMSE